MARLLHRLGAFSVRRRRTVLASWLVAFGVMAAVSFAFAGEFTGNFSIPGTESQKANDLIQAKTPDAGADAPSGRVVFAAPAGRTLASGAGRAAVERTIDAIERVPGVASASNPFESSAVSEDGRVAFTSVDFAPREEQTTASPRAGVARASEAALEAGLRVEYAGAAAGGGQGGEEGFPIGELLGVSVAILVLAITFGSMIAAGLPLLTALLGVGFGILGIMLATSVTPLSSESITLAVMLGLAVGIDYTLFILSRHRTQVHDGMGIEPSIARAVGTAGSAVVFAGATVIIALVALLVTGVPFLGQMGIAAAGTIAVAVLLSLTLVPALMAFAGPRATRGKSSSAALHDLGADEKPTLGARWIALVMRRRALAIAVPVLALGALALPALDMRLGQANDGALGPDTTQRQAYDLLSDGFGPGFNGPLTIAAEVPPGGGAQRAADATAAELERFDGVAAVSPAQLNPAGDLALIQVTPDSGPSTTATEEPRQPHPRSGRPDRGRHRRHRLDHRRDRDRHRHRTDDVRRARPLPERRHGPRAHPAHARLPLDPDPTDRDRRLPAHHRRSVRRRRHGLPGRVRREPPRRRAGRTDRQPAADHRHRRALRAGDGLPGLPGLPHARGVQARRHAEATPSATGSATEPASSPPPP